MPTIDETLAKITSALSRYIPIASGPVVLAGAPTSGPAAEHARTITDRFEDVRFAVVILAGAAEQAAIALDACPDVGFAELLPRCAWAHPARAAVHPLRQIIEACAAFENALPRVQTSAQDDASPDGGREDSNQDLKSQTATLKPDDNVAAVNAVSACLPSLSTRETIAAVAAVQAALPDARSIAAIDQTVAALERFGVPALVSSSPLSSAEGSQLLRDLPRLSPPDEAAFAAAARDFARFSPAFSKG
jgi:hypothetical protein